MSHSRLYLKITFKKTFGSSLWCNGLRIRCCNGRGRGGGCSMDFTPGLGSLETQKKTKKKKKKKTQKTKTKTTLGNF